MAAISETVQIYKGVKCKRCHSSYCGTLLFKTIYQYCQEMECATAIGQGYCVRLSVVTKGREKAERRFYYTKTNLIASCKTVMHRKSPTLHGSFWALLDGGPSGGSVTGPRK